MILQARVLPTSGHPSQPVRLGTPGQQSILGLAAREPSTLLSECGMSFMAHCRFFMCSTQWHLDCPKYLIWRGGLSGHFGHTRTNFLAHLPHKRIDRSTGTVSALETELRISADRGLHFSLTVEGNSA